MIILVQVVQDAEIVVAAAVGEAAVILNASTISNETINYYKKRTS